MHPNYDQTKEKRKEGKQKEQGNEAKSGKKALKFEMEIQV